jgi:nucleoside-triphosphatase
MNIFITGNPGSGKSTLVQRQLADLSDKRVSGFITPEFRTQGKRQGFKFIDLASGMEETLAAVDIDRGPGVSRYRVNTEGIDRILDKFQQSYPGSEVVVIDEIGMMEFYSPKFREIIRKVLDSGKIVIATLSKRLAREYSGRGHTYDLTRENADETYRNVLSHLKK